jgi:hypothetical protein
MCFSSNFGRGAGFVDVEASAAKLSVTLLRVSHASYERVNVYVKVRQKCVAL